MLETVRKYFTDEGFLREIKMGFIIGLLLLCVLQTENPVSHWYSIENIKRSQYKIMKNINSTSTKQKLRAFFDRNYDYIELIQWTHNQLNFSDHKPDPIPKNPFDIMNLGYGRCGEFSILYASACLSHGYNARLVLILRGSNHEWVEVQINDEWIHVDPTNPPQIHVNEPEMYRDRNKVLHLVVAFEQGRFEVVTNKYQLRARSS